MGRERILRGVARRLLAAVGAAPSPDRGARALFAAGLVGTAFLLLSVPYVPFQDIPNHAQLLVLDQSLGADGSAYLRRPEMVSFGYSLYVWMARLLLPGLSIDIVMRLMCLAAALALPLATARLAAVLGGPWAVTGILALPLGLGWPLRMGFISFALGLPVALLGTSGAVLLCRERGATRMAGLGFCALVAYLAHPFAFGLLSVLAGLSWLCAGARSRSTATPVLVALAPAVLLAGIDAWNGAWLPVTGLEDAATGGGLRFQSIGMALVHVVSRSYGITGPGSLGLYLPHFALVVCGALWLARSPGRLESRGLVLFGAAAFMLGSVGFPYSMGRLISMGPRANVIGLCFGAIAGAAWLSCSRARPLLVAVPLTALAFVASSASIVHDARLVHEVVGDRPPRNVAGNFLAVQAADCARPASFYWGDWDPVRHLWAYALSPEGITPYLFARDRYFPVWYRAERRVPYPSGGRSLGNGRALDPAACDRRNRERVATALSYPGFDGVIVVGRPGDGERALGLPGAASRDRVAPGIWRLTR
jgi:hypothetical protein